MMSFIQNCIRLGSRVSESCCDRLLCLTSLNRVFQSLFPSIIFILDLQETVLRDQ